MTTCSTHIASGLVALCKSPVLDRKKKKKERGRRLGGEGGAKKEVEGKWEVQEAERSRKKLRA